MHSDNGKADFEYDDEVPESQSNEQHDANEETKDDNDKFHASFVTPPE